MKLKPRIVTLTAAAIISTAACTAAFVASDTNAPPVTVSAEESTVEYYLRDCDGFIAVYKGESSTPADITNIETATLNDTDYKKLQSGIAVQSRNELLMLLEDLGS